MTDNEIVKALKCCKDCSSPEDCGECPYIECTTKKGCFDELLTDALDLINRQKAEIEKQDAEIQRLNYILQCYALEYGAVVDKEGVLKKAKSDAVKEFAERLHEKLSTIQTAYNARFGEMIDNLAKEFTEGEKK